MDVAMIECQPQTCIKGVHWLLRWGARNSHPDAARLSSRLASHGGVPKLLWEASQREHVTANMKTRTADLQYLCTR